MKHLKEFKIFEKFESIQLNKLFSFLSKKGKESFLSALKNISLMREFKLSAFSDELFQYLPFKSALNLKVDKNSSECPTCHGEGKYTRPWGKHERTVLCKECSGTGVVEKDHIRLKYIKFWFDTNGNYIGSTISDGSLKQSRFVNHNGQKYSIIPIEDPSELKDGDLIKCNLNRGGYGGGRRGVIGTVYVYRGIRYSIQDESGYQSPSSDESWKKYGTHAHRIMNAGTYYDYSELYLLVPTTEDEVDPYSWNFVSDKSLYKINKETKEYLKNANFAIILDYEKLQSKKITGGTTLNPIQISRSRKDSRSGAYALKKNNEIQKDNFTRYLNTLTNNFKEKNGPEDLKNILLRIIRGPYSLFNLRSFGFDLFNKIFDFLVNAKKNPEYSNYYFGEIMPILKDGYQKSLEYRDSYQRSYDDIFKVIKSENLTNIQKIYDDFIEIGNLLTNQIQNFKVNDFEDLEFLISKLSSIRSNIDRRFGLSGMVSDVYHQIGSETGSLINNLSDYNQRPDSIELDRKSFSLLRRKIQDIDANK